MSLFGAFLVTKHMVTAEQVLEALDRQRALRPPLGQMALRRGLIDARQLLDVLDAQRKDDRKRFGEVALELGYMRKEDVQNLVAEQESSGPRLGELLVTMGYLSARDCEVALSEFSQQGRTQSGGWPVLPKAAGTR